MSARKRGESTTIFPRGRMLQAANRSPMTLDGTRTYIVGSKRPVVIDPGPADEPHFEALVALLEGSTPAAILLTHAHRDHAGIAEALAERTGAPIVMGRGARWLPFPEERVSAWLGHGDAVDCDAGPVQAVATPGHAPEHLAFLYVGERVRALFAGDLFLGVGDTTLVSHPEGDVAQYLRSLEVVRGVRPTVIFPAHGPALRHPAQAVTRYRAHRLERIEQVRKALAEAPEADAETLGDRVYGAELDPRLRRAAIGSVEAILTYLNAEGEAWARE